jgi:hypothetical protein
VVQADRSAAGSHGGSGGDAVRKEVLEVRFKLAEGVVVRAGAPVVVRAGAPLTLVSAGRPIGTFENVRITAGLRAGFGYSGAIVTVDIAKRRGVARLQVG